MPVDMSAFKSNAIKKRYGGNIRPFYESILAYMQLIFIQMDDNEVKAPQVGYPIAISRTL